MRAEENDKPKILLIIGDWRTRALVHAQLDEEGFEARSSLSWIEALALIDRPPQPRFEAIVVDVSDDKVDDLLRRRLAFLANRAPIVALTGVFGPQPEDLLAMGVQDVLRRPVTVGEVSRALRRMAKSAPVRS
jgi:CheY-like chemotaxis protein